MPPVSIPKDVAQRVVAVFAERGVEWLEQFPRLVADLAAQWQLIEIGIPFPGTRAGFVAPVVGPTGREMVLKISPAPAEIRHEALALEYWGGRGAVRLEATDSSRGALLLERVVPGHSLEALALSDDRAATEVASGVIAELQCVGSPPPKDLPTIETWLVSLQLSARPDAPGQLAQVCREAQVVAHDLLCTSDDWVVLHGDLHHDNVLSVGHEGWIATDPKGLLGPHELETAALLRNPRHHVLAQSDPAALIRSRILELTKRLGYDPRRMAQWGFVLAALAATWALEDGEGEREVDRWLSCAAVLREADILAN